MAKKLPVIIDNRSAKIVFNALKQILSNLKKAGIAIGVFAAGSLLSLQGLWQDLEKIRILM
jgi:hypothetical protein